MGKYPILNMLIPLLTSLLASCNKKTWSNLVKNLQIDKTKMIELHKTRIIRETVTEFKAEASHEAALTSLVSLAPAVVIPRLMDSVQNILKEAAAIRVSRDEYFTYLTPEGELYDKSGIPGKVVVIGDMDKNIDIQYIGISKYIYRCRYLSGCQISIIDISVFDNFN